MAAPLPDPIFDKIYRLTQGMAQVIQMGEALMAGQAELMAKIAELQSGQTELLKDARRLLAAGDTTAAMEKLDEVIASNTQLDTEIEAAAPETPATPEPGAGGGGGGAAPAGRQQRGRRYTPEPGAAAEPAAPAAEELNLSGS
jgi:hypothetical protein